MRIDAHTHIGQGAAERGADDLLQMLDAYELDHAITFPGPSGLAGSPRQVLAANDYVAQAVRQHPDRITGFGTANPWHAEEALEEIDRLAGTGLRGLKLHPPIQGFVLSDRSLLDPVLERAARHALPVVIHAGLRVAGLPYVMVSLDDIGALALAHPQVAFVVAHSGWGGRDARGADVLARDCPNVWFDTAGINIPDQIRALTTAGAAERMLYGSDFPFLHPRVELLRVELASLSPAIAAGVLGDNARRLLAPGG